MDQIHNFFFFFFYFKTIQCHFNTEPEVAVILLEIKATFAEMIFTSQLNALSEMLQNYLWYVINPTLLFPAQQQVTENPEIWTVFQLRHKLLLLPCASCLQTVFQRCQIYVASIHCTGKVMLEKSSFQPWRVGFFVCSDIFFL